MRFLKVVSPTLRRNENGDDINAFHFIPLLAVLLLCRSLYSAGFPLAGKYSVVLYESFSSRQLLIRASDQFEKISRTVDLCFRLYFRLSYIVYRHNNKSKQLINRTYMWLVCVGSDRLVRIDDRHSIIFSYDNYR